MNNASNPFCIIKGRYIALIWILPTIYLPGAGLIYHAIDQSWHPFWRPIFYIYYGHALFISVLVILGFHSKLNWKSLMGKKPDGGELLPALKVTLFIFLFSIAAAYLFFLPLSYVTPEFVEWWYIYSVNVIYWDGQSYPIAINLFNVLSLVVIAPVFEELAFRGMLLHRWAQKWNLSKAIILSSLLFAVVHSDPIGAFAFGIAMCILYLRTQSLFVPIICHMANNIVVWLIEVGYRFVEGPEYRYTLELFRDEWYIGLVSGIIVVAWASIYLRNPTGLKTWRLPDV